MLLLQPPPFLSPRAPPPAAPLLVLLLQTPSPLPESFFDSSTVASPGSYFESAPSPLSVRIAWLILVLLCKLDSKASNLRLILGEDWAFKHDSKVRHYASSYERLGWAWIAAMIPAAELPEVAAERIRAFYAVFEEVARVQKEWIVADEWTREDVRESMADLIVPSYRAFYEAYRPIFLGSVSGDKAAVRYAPEDVRARVMELFRRLGESSSVSGTGRRRRWRRGAGRRLPGGGCGSDRHRGKVDG